jgi:hypothetical protein
MIMIPEALGSELHKIASFLRDLSTQQVPLDRTQKDIAFVTAKWIEKEIPKCLS